MASEDVEFDLKSRGSSLAYGEAGQLEQAAEDVEDLAEASDLGGVEPPDIEALLNDEDFLPDDVEEPGPEPPATPSVGGLESLIFSPSLRREEPLTAGAPVGPGPLGIPPLNDERQLGRFVRRMAQAPGAPDEVKSFAERFERGI